MSFLTRLFRISKDVPAPSGPCTLSEKKVPQLKHALGCVHVLARDRPADRRWVNANLFGDFLDHHGLELVDPLVQKVTLPADDSVTDLQNRLTPLLDVLDQLHRGFIPFFHVRLYVFLHAAVLVVQHLAIGSD